MNKNIYLKLRLERQHFTKPAGKKEYGVLFKQMSPVLCVYWSCPGSPPELLYRAAFDDRKYCYKMRGSRTIMKGRFQNGNIAYIYADELELFAAVYRKDKPLTDTELELYELLNREGPMTIHVMKEFTGMLTKEITPALHRLQEKFLVFEDQADSEWDRAWYPFESEFPDVNLERYTKEEAEEELVRRFVWLNVWIDAAMVRSFYRLPLKEIKGVLERLVSNGTLAPYEGGYVRREDLQLLEGDPSDTVENAPKETEKHSVFILHKNDFLVKSNEHWLKDTFTHPEYDVLGYLLIDGAFRGCLLGHFRNGPFELEDVALWAETGGEEPVCLRNEAADGLKAALKEDILNAVELLYDPEISPLKRYMGEMV